MGVCNTLWRFFQATCQDPAVLAETLPHPGKQSPRDKQAANSVELSCGTGPKIKIVPARIVAASNSQTLLRAA